MAKAKKIEVDGKTYNVTWLANLVLEGKDTLTDIEAKCPTAVVAAVSKLVGKERARPDVATVFGRVIRRTDKAILFQVDAAHNGVCLADFAEAWLPLSQVKVLEDAKADRDAVTMPGWLLAEKNSDARKAV